MHSPNRHALAGTRLLRLGRGSIDHRLVHSEPLPIEYDTLPRALAGPTAVFATPCVDGELRGCYATLEAAHPLATDAARPAFQAAFRDPPFDLVGGDEIGATRLGLSVLSALEPMTVREEAALLERLSQDTVGLDITEGMRRATALPGVRDSLPAPRRFLAMLKTRRGLPQDCRAKRLEHRHRGTTTCTELS